MGARKTSRRIRSNDTYGGFLTGASGSFEFHLFQFVLDRVGAAFQVFNSVTHDLYFTFSLQQQYRSTCADRYEIALIRLDTWLLDLRPSPHSKVYALSPSRPLKRYRPRSHTEQSGDISRPIQVSVDSRAGKVVIKQQVQDSQSPLILHDAYISWRLAQNVSELIDAVSS